MKKINIRTALVPTLNPSTDHHKIRHTWLRYRYPLPQKIWAQSVNLFLPIRRKTLRRQTLQSHCLLCHGVREIIYQRTGAPTWTWWYTCTTHYTRPCNNQLSLAIPLGARWIECQPAWPGLRQALLLLVIHYLLLYLWSKCAAVIGSNRVAWCKLIWGIDRFTGQYVDRHIDRLTYWPVRMVFLNTGQNQSVKKLKLHFLTVRVCIWSKCQIICIN